VLEQNGEEMAVVARLATTVDALGERDRDTGLRLIETLQEILARP
jgi:hypothetical protein